MNNERSDREHLIQVCEQRKEFVSGDDGFVYWWPSGSTYGCVNSYGLRCIADELDRRNAGWQKTIDDHFDKERHDWRAL